MHWQSNGLWCGQQGQCNEKRAHVGRGLGEIFLVSLLAPASQGSEALLRPGVTLPKPAAIPCRSAACCGFGQRQAKLGSIDIPGSVPNGCLQTWDAWGCSCCRPVTWGHHVEKLPVSCRHQGCLLIGCTVCSFCPQFHMHFMA